METGFLHIVLSVRRIEDGVPSCGLARGEWWSNCRETIFVLEEWLGLHGNLGFCYLAYLRRGNFDRMLTGRRELGCVA